MTKPQTPTDGDALDNDGRFPSGRATAVEPVPVSPLRDGIPSAADLLATIRSTVAAWAGHYSDASGHSVRPEYLSSLANDVAFELGILEAAQGIEAGTVKTAGLDAKHESPTPQGDAPEADRLTSPTAQGEG